MSYLEPINCASEEVEIKKSRFIAIAKKIISREDAMNFINEVKASYPDARHHCWAYLLGDPLNPINCASNDDGEPSGTAGRPILSQISYSNIGNLIVVVVRFFGGVKLGVGGLVRAYREVVQKVLKTLHESKKDQVLTIALVKRSFSIGYCPFFLPFSILNKNDIVLEDSITLLFNKAFLGYFYYQFLVSIRRNTK